MSAVSSFVRPSGLLGRGSWSALCEHPWFRALILIGGLLACQAVLYGPSLIGRKLLLNLGDLVQRGVYVPPAADRPPGLPHDWSLSDIVFTVEPDRVYATEEIRQGRLPLWSPYNYCGVPFFANNNTAVFSPFMLPSYLWPDPRVVAWIQVLRALVAGIGAYLFFRKVLGVGFGPAVVGSWCYPLIGYMVLLGWVHHASVIAWLPWILLATDRAVRRPRGWGGIGLAGVTALTLYSGKLDTSAQVLLASGLYAIWCLIDRHKLRRVLTRSGWPSIGALAAGWGLGIALAGPVVLPTAEFLQEGARLEARRQGEVNYPGVGLKALPQLVLPYFYGSTQAGSRYLSEGNRVESAALGYAGLLMTLLLAPLGLTDRSRRSFAICWVILALIALAPQLRIPLLEKLYLLPPLNLLQNHRFAFLAAWSVLSLGVMWLEMLRGAERVRRWWFWGAVLLLAGLGAWCAIRTQVLPADWQPQLDEPARAWFRREYLLSSLACLTGILLWMWLLFNRRWNFATWCVPVLFVLAELLYNARGVLPQTDPEMYYPELPILAKLQQAPPGRIIGVNCLPTSLNRMSRLRDIRGYDGSDPKGMVELLWIANPYWESKLDYAVTQNFAPQLSTVDFTLRQPAPILNMLNLRYLLFQGHPPDDVDVWAAEEGYFVVENPHALPRAFVPRSFRLVADQRQSFRGLASPNFQPEEIAYVERASRPSGLEIEGTARIVDDDVPGRITIDWTMQTPGLVVISESWAAGWHAAIDGDPAPVLRVNGALQGVELPAGSGTLTLWYWPESLTDGLQAGGMAVLLLTGWGIVLVRRSPTFAGRRLS